MRFLLFAILCSSSLLKTEASEILFIAAVATKSHFFGFIGELVNVLGEKGHHVTLFNSHDIKLNDNVTRVEAGVSLDKIMPNTFESRNGQTTLTLLHEMPVLCAESLVEFHKQKLDVKNFDLVMIEMFANECFYSIMREEVPIIMVSPNTIAGAMHDYVGNIDFPSFVPLVGLPFHFPMPFWTRFANALFVIPTYAFTVFRLQTRILETCRDVGHCNDINVSIMEKVKHVSLAIVNSVRALENPPRPYVPGVVHAGALHTKPAKSLPEDLRSWIEGAGEAGVIYFSLGTVVKCSELPDRYRSVLIKVFESLPQRVIWKCDVETMDDLPPNAKIFKWLPQQDILGHPNVRIFITHGGLFSITEATYHAVPILGFPVFGDQKSNMLYAVHEGIGESIEWDDLTEELLKQKLDTLLREKKYKDAIQHRSELMKDQPMSPQETVVYWTEYVIRHKGAKHLRSPVLDMTWIEVYNIDVWATALAIAVAFLALVLLLLRFVARKCFGTKDINQKEKKKHN